MAKIPLQHNGSQEEVILLIKTNIEINRFFVGNTFTVNLSTF